MYLIECYFLKPIDSIIAFQKDEFWLHWNKGTKTVEFDFVIDGEKASIDIADKELAQLKYRV